MKILIVDDHALFREGMCYVLAQLAEDVAIVEAGTGAEALQTLESNHDIALVLLDIDMPGHDGFSVLEIFSRQHAALPIVILSASEDRVDMQRALDNGAVGFIPKSMTAPVMLSALRLILTGGVYVPPALVQSGGNETAAHFTALELESVLTTRQREVLIGMVKGKPNKIIAAELALSEATVKAHISAVFKVLRVSNRTQAASAAARVGLG
jgi:DNA-binding NarL/FixJ family response regulator